MRVSHETIYLTLFIQARAALKRELVAHLRWSRSIRRPRTASRANRGQGQIVDAVSIRERPAEAADRAIPGHWEGDLLSCVRSPPPPSIAPDRNHKTGESLPSVDLIM